MDSCTPSDAELIQEILKGSLNSFETLISRYETKAYNLALKLTRNPEDAEEVLQDVFVTLYRKLDSFEGKSAFSSWLYRITVNASFMKLRRQKRFKLNYAQEVLEEQLRRHAGDMQSLTVPNRTLERAELRAVLDLAIECLTPEYRTVFILRDVDGLSNQEVGDILDLSISAVKSRLHRSRVILRRKLRESVELMQENGCRSLTQLSPSHCLIS